jgi:hypothetical protein
MASPLQDLRPEQRLLLCQWLASRAGYADFWDANGPTRSAREFRDLARARSVSSAVVSPRDVELVRLAWDVWNETGGASVIRLLTHLEPMDLGWVGSLFSALSLGADSVDTLLKTLGAHNG